MIKTLTKQLLSTTLSLLLVIVATPYDAGAQQSAQQGTAGYSGQGAPLSADELQQLLAPIALYPDSLVAQILGAATFPDQIAGAAGWLQQNSNLKGTALMQAVDSQPWDPSVKALTQFPSVLDNLAKNLSWTSAMGEAYHTQAAEVMSAVQALRAKAKVCRQFEIRLTDYGRARVAASHRDSASESASGIRSRVQPHGGLRLSLCDSRLCRASHGGNRSSCFWSWRCGWRDDEQHLLRLGIQLLELWLARHHYGRVSRRGLLRKQRLARRLLRLERLCLWS